MPEPSVLGQVALGYSPMMDRQHAVVATRLTVFPQRPEVVPDLPALLAALDEIWPADDAAAPGTTAAPARAAGAAGESGLRITLRSVDAGAATFSAPGAAPGGAPQPATPARPKVVLNLAGEGLLHAAMAAVPGPHVMLEVPAFMATDPAHAAALLHLHAQGTPLLLKGRPREPLPPGVRECFGQWLAEDDGKVAAAAGARLALLIDGVRTSAAADQVFARGASAVFGWPFDDPLTAAAAKRKGAPEVQVVMALISGIDREEPVSRLEATLKRDPTLAFRLMRYLNSPAFGLSVEINSFGHALMLLGYQRLKRWLALLLASSNPDALARPVLFAAVRRGLLMEELVRQQGDAELRGEMFICGVFSLLDRLLGQPVEELLASVPVPERVAQALRGEGGPHLPFLNLVQAIEAGSAFDIREQAEHLLLGPAEVNRAVLAALRAGRLLD